MKEEISVFLENFYAGLTNMLPRVILALVIILLGYLIAIIVQKLTRRFILYLNQGLNQQLKNSPLNVDLKNSAAFISRTIFWIIIVISLLICLHVLKLEFLSNWFERVVVFLPNVLVAVIIVFAGIIAGRLLGDLITSGASRNLISNAKYLGNFVRYFILFIALVIAVDQLGVDIGFLTNLFSIILASLLFGASLAFGLGARTSVSNILGSYYARKSYPLGTRIRIGETEGTIIKIADSAISLETESGILVIPAKEFNDSHIIVVKDKSV